MRLAVVCFLALAVLSGCATRTSRGVLDVRVTNGDDAPVQDVAVDYRNGQLWAGSLGPRQSVRKKFSLVDKEPILIRYRDSDGRVVEREYDIHARPENGVRMDFRIDLNGDVTPVSRIDLH